MDFGNGQAKGDQKEIFEGRREKEICQRIFEKKNACLDFGLEKKWGENSRQFFGRKEKACIYRKWICSKPD